MKTCSILKNGKEIISYESYGETIENPIEINITIEEEVLKKIKDIADYYKWSLEDALLELLSQEPKEIIEKAEMKLQGII